MRLLVPLNNPPLFGSIILEYETCKVLLRYVKTKCKYVTEECDSISFPVKVIEINGILTEKTIEYAIDMAQKTKEHIWVYLLDEKENTDAMNSMLRIQYPYYIACSKYKNKIKEYVNIGDILDVENCVEKITWYCDTNNNKCSIVSNTYKHHALFVKLKKRVVLESINLSHFVRLERVDDKNNCIFGVAKYPVPDRMAIFTCDIVVGARSTICDITCNQLTLKELIEISEHVQYDIGMYKINKANCFHFVKHVMEKAIERGKVKNENNVKIKIEEQSKEHVLYERVQLNRLFSWFTD